MTSRHANFDGKVTRAWIVEERIAEEFRRSTLGWDVDHPPPDQNPDDTMEQRLARKDRGDFRIARTRDDGSLQAGTVEVKQINNCTWDSIRTLRWERPMVDSVLWPDRMAREDLKALFYFLVNPGCTMAIWCTGKVARQYARLKRHKCTNSNGKLVDYHAAFVPKWRFHEHKLGPA